MVKLLRAQLKEKTERESCSATELATQSEPDPDLVPIFEEIIVDLIEAGI